MSRGSVREEGESVIEFWWWSWYEERLEKKKRIFQRDSKVSLKKTKFVLKIEKLKKTQMEESVWRNDVPQKFFKIMNIRTYTKKIRRKCRTKKITF